MLDLGVSTDMGVIILIAIVSGMVGLLVGIGLHRGVSSAESRARDLNRALEDAEENNRRYQQQVAVHFSQTASMLNDLTEQYKNVHHHLAQGADTLCRDAAGNSLLLNNDQAAEDTVATPAETTEPLQPPLDYAPKNEGSNTGTLAEDYGLEKVHLSETEAAEAAADPSRLANTEALRDDLTVTAIRAKQAASGADAAETNGAKAS